ncbi:MAG: Stealth CR1 domain-containing protein, partial [Dysgonamonadaceae bacterium]|nr:Stealth CR1 domain-containing protein [Dysgonamonadaceae bacterium]
MDIDLVYLWVDGNDPVWQARKNAFLGIETAEDEINCKGRHANNDELKYSLRSVEKYLPWIRKIFIVTDNQIPDWLDTSHPGIQMISHKDILPEEAMPCYNSVVIEYFLYRIPGLSEHFLYGNDDMFFNASLSPLFFFTEDGFPYVRLKRKLFGKWRYRWKKWWGKSLSTYRTTILKAAQLIENRYGKFYSGVPHHNIDAYRKTDYRAVVETVFKPVIDPCIPHHKRSPDDIQRALFVYYALVVKHGYPR